MSGLLDGLPFAGPAIVFVLTIAGVALASVFAVGVIWLVAWQTWRGRIALLDEQVTELGRHVLDLRTKLARAAQQAQAAPPAKQPGPAHPSVRAEAAVEPDYAPPPVHFAVPTEAGHVQAAGEALAGPDAFRRFAAASRGYGAIIISGAQRFEAIPPGEDPMSADLWLVPFEDKELIFPGYNLRRTLPALLSDAQRSARERLGWLFELQSGDRLAARRPAVWANGELHRPGALELPE